MSAYMDEAEWVRSICRGYAERIEELERENAALLQDKERLDWLNKTKLWKPDIRTALDAYRIKEGGAS